MLHLEIEFYDDMGRVHVAHQTVAEDKLVTSGGFILVRGGRPIPVHYRVAVTHTAKVDA